MSNSHEYLDWPNWPPQPTPYPSFCLYSISTIDPWLIVPGCLYNPLVCEWAMPPARIWGRIAFILAPWVFIAASYTFIVLMATRANPSSAMLFIVCMEWLVFPTFLPAVAAAMVYVDVKAFVVRLPLEEISVTPLTGREFRAGLFIPSLPLQINCCWGMLGISLLLTLIPLSRDLDLTPGLIFLCPAVVRPKFNSILLQAISVTSIRFIATNETLWRFLVYAGSRLFWMTLRCCFCVVLLVIGGGFLCLMFVGFVVVPVGAIFLARHLRDSAMELLDREVIEANWDLRRDRDTIADFWRSRQESLVR